MSGGLKHLCHDVVNSISFQQPWQRYKVDGRDCGDECSFGHKSRKNDAETEQKISS